MRELHPGPVGALHSLGSSLHGDQGFDGYRTGFVFFSTVFLLTAKFPGFTGPSLYNLGSVCFSS